ncbi:unannotated protein [freshwater metagenome]|uniref:Unannotated protein n=1 Tax=freshwater metagenome TaxID=449393 RepID=A0A6J7NDG2_9ZZZZ
MSPTKKFGLKPLAPFITTLAKIDIQGVKASAAVANIATLTNISFRTFASALNARTVVTNRKTIKNVNAQPSTPARPVTRTMNAAASAEIEKVTTVPSCSPRVRFHGVVGIGIAVDC